MEGRFFSYSDDPFVPGSSRIKRSPKPRRKHQVNGCPGDAEKDRLITTDSDGTYRRPPGVHNSAYIGCPVRGADPSPLEAGWGGFQGKENEQRWLVLQGQWGCEVGGGGVDEGADLSFEGMRKPYEPGCCGWTLWRQTLCLPFLHARSVLSAFKTGTSRG